MRRKKEQELKTVINERRLLLERLTFEFDSLQKVE